jgi:hypothetical protein
MPPPFLDTLMFFIENMGDEIEVDFAHPHFGAKARLSGEGLTKVVKTALRYAPQKQ